MRKLALLAMPAMLAIAAPAHADVGIGVFLGEPTGLDVKLGLTPRSGLDLVFGWETYRTDEHYGHLTYLLTPVVAHGSSVIVPLRIGIGVAVFDDGSFNNGTNVAARVPVELGLRFRSVPLEIYGEVALKLTFVRSHGDPYADLDGGIGLRFYF